MKLGAVQLFALAKSVGFTDDQAELMAAISLAESGGRTDEVGDVALANATWGPSIGLWQVRSLNADRGTGRTRDALILTDAKANAKAARTIWHGQGYHAWSVYTNGAYGQFMDEARAARGQLGGEDPSTLDKIGGVLGDVGKTAVLGPIGLIPGIGGVGGAVVGAAGGALHGIDAIGEFFAALGKRATWVRVLQVWGGAVMVAGGLVLLGKDVMAPAAGALLQAHPAGRAASLAGSVAQSAKK